MGIFVAIEGNDYVGKTTNAISLAERINGIYYSTRKELLEARKLFKDCKDKIAKHLFFLSLTCLASEDIRTLLKTTNVVVDRYLISFKCYHWEYLNFVDIDNLDLIVPNLTICLEVNEKELLERVKKRGEEVEIDLFRYKFISEKMRSLTMREKGIVLNTAEESYKVVNHIVEELKNRKLL